MAAVAASLRSEDGFTLIELLVGMVISLILLLATLQSFDLFTRTAAHQTRVTDANDQVRFTMDRTVSDLRGASVITNAAATDLTYTVAEPAGLRTVRLCLASGDLYRSSTVAPATPPAACSAGTKIAALKSTNTAFTYDGASSSATPADVKDVGLTFSLDATTGSKTTTSTLQASAARRSSGTLPIVKDSDIRATCDSTGTLLSLNVSALGLGPLSVTFTTSTGLTLTATDTSTVHIPGGGAVTVTAAVTNSLGATKILQRSVECT
jgi:prepilin-type N-terminal cleavage/methylation domain-containing protein